MYVVATLSFIIGINYSIDASDAIRPDYTELAKASLSGHTVAVPENYNDRVYQRYIISSMEKLPETLVIGSSRGMYIGKDITGMDDIYNSCVAGATIADYFAVLGMYYERFNELPKTIIIEVSPWVFYKGNPEMRWADDKQYLDSALSLYKTVTGSELSVPKYSKENPYISLSYLRYNAEQLIKNGTEVFISKVNTTPNDSDMADLPDGTIRYPLHLENETEERLEIVKDVYGPCTYQNSDQMTELSSGISEPFEKLIDYLLNNNTKILMYLQPFSVTQSFYIFDEGLNPAYPMVEEYIINICNQKGIELKGSYDPHVYGLNDSDFIDFMHLDKKGTRITWSQSVH